MQDFETVKRHTSTAVVLNGASGRHAVVSALGCIAPHLGMRSCGVARQSAHTKFAEKRRTFKIIMARRDITTSTVGRRAVEMQPLLDLANHRAASQDAATLNP
jgi:hypothetical protein